MSAHFRTRYLLASAPGFALLVACGLTPTVRARARWSRHLGAAMAAMAVITIVMAWPGAARCARRHAPDFGWAVVPLVSGGVSPGPLDRAQSGRAARWSEA
jgi:hypothetical protein